MLSREPARHRKTPRHRMMRRPAPARPRALTVLAASAWVAVVTVLAGLLVTGASPRITATPAPGSSARAAAGAVISDAATRPAVAQTARTASISQAGQSRAARAAVTPWTVRHGQTLSGIAGSWCGIPSDWTGLYAANKGVIGGNPNLIQPGQRYSRGCYQTRAPPGPAAATTAASSSPAPHGSGWGVIYGDPNYWGDGDGDGYDLNHSPWQQASPAPAAQSAYPAPAAQPAYQAQGSYQAPQQANSGGGFQACVIARESGGSATAVNPSSGAGGLYGFLPSTWQALGHSGLPENASVAEQNQAFQQEYAQAGTSPWHPYDGC